LKKYAGADVHYLGAVKADSKHTSAYNNLVKWRYVAKNFEGALKFLNQSEANGVTITPGLA
jgi:Flp pilus assembly protein TadD